MFISHSPFFLSILPILSPLIRHGQGGWWIRVNSIGIDKECVIMGIFKVYQTLPIPPISRQSLQVCPIIWTVNSLMK
jgi:hypothetical protein